MAGKTMDERVHDFEKLAEKLAPLPGEMSVLSSRMAAVEGRLENVESQVLQLRANLDDRTTAILEVIDSGSKATERMFDEVVRTVKDGDEETRRQMRVLHEDLVDRIGRLGN